MACAARRRSLSGASWPPAAARMEAFERRVRDRRASWDRGWAAAVAAIDALARRIRDRIAFCDRIGSAEVLGLECMAIVVSEGAPMRWRGDLERASSGRGERLRGARVAGACRWRGSAFGGAILGSGAAPNLRLGDRDLVGLLAQSRFAMAAAARSGSPSLTDAWGILRGPKCSATKAQVSKWKQG